MNNKTIEQKIQRTEKEITRLEHQKKIKQHEAKQLERNRRNRRIFTRGGMLERFMQRPLLLTDDQVYQLLQTAFNTEAVQTMEKALINEAVRAMTQAAEDTNTNAETVVLLSKGEIDSKKVRVEFSLEDMDMSGFQKGATYEQIKAYVLEHTGLKVSSLYISQIKRKCGLDVGQNYNLSKKEDAKVPKCPPEKEAAIRDALKYFQMI